MDIFMLREVGKIINIAYKLGRRPCEDGFIADGTATPLRRCIIGFHNRVLLSSNIFSDHLYRQHDLRRIGSVKMSHSPDHNLVT